VDATVATVTSAQPTDSTLDPISAATMVTATELDFKTKVERMLDQPQARAAVAEGRFVWFDIQAGSDARQVLTDLGLISQEVVDDALLSEPLTRLARYPDYLHLVVSGCRPRGHHFDLERVDVVVGQHFFLTIHRAPALFLTSVKRDYRADFVRFAQSPSFLIYELWDHLLENYLAVQKTMEQRVEQMQDELRADDVESTVFRRISELGADLLHFRKIVLPARSVLSELATRKSPFVSEATQPFLANMVGTVEHVLQDLLVDRDILSESLNLYMSMVGHRTNEVMKKLTIVSVVFLPLTFLVGVYGMNFDEIPELKWHHGYLYFWLIAIGIVVLLGVLMRRLRLL
jgi:magnesium transporter